MTVAQAFHWFDGERALAEVHRVLRPGGALALVWNERHEDDPVNRAIDALVDPVRNESNAPHYGDGTWREAFERSRLFGPAREQRHRNEQTLDAGGLADRVGSVSFVSALEPTRREALLARVRALADDGPVVVPYTTAGADPRPSGVGSGGMETRLTLVTLGVSDLARARAFYETLGWRNRASEGAGVVFFQSGGMVLGLWDRGLLAEDSCVQDDGGWGGVTLAHNVRSPAEVDAVLDEARAAGASVRREGAPTDRGGYSGLFVDPQGHPWEVAHNPDGSSPRTGPWYFPEGANVCPVRLLACAHQSFRGDAPNGEGTGEGREGPGVGAKGALTQIERQFGAGSIMKMGDDAFAVQVEAVPTGAISLDLALGVGGLPRGRIVEIFGPGVSGKTTLLYHVLAQRPEAGRDLCVHRRRARHGPGLRQAHRRGHG